MSEAAETPEGQTTENASAGGGGGGGNKLVMIITLVNMVATLGVLGVLFVGHQKEASKPTVEDILADKKAAHGGGGDHGGGDAKGDHGGGDKKGAADANIDSGKIIPLESFAVNLATGAGQLPRYIRMNVSMELEKGAKEDEFKVKTPRVRDTIISLLNSKRPTDISTPEGRELLKDEIKRAVNGYMTDSKVKGVYFTNFAVSN